jgi:hypothetical protein
MLRLATLPLLLLLAASGAGDAPKAPRIQAQSYDTLQTAAPPALCSPGPCCGQQDCDCGDFRSRAAALRCFHSHPGDPHNLDADGDGRPCEELIDD